jgi:hypothetical protein
MPCSGTDSCSQRTLPCRALRHPAALHLAGPETPMSESAFKKLGRSRALASGLSPRSANPSNSSAGHFQASLRARALGFRLIVERERRIDNEEGAPHQRPLRYWRIELKFKANALFIGPCEGCNGSFALTGYRSAKIPFTHLRYAWAIASAALT